MKDIKHQHSYKSFTDDPTVPITPYEPPSDYDITTPKTVHGHDHQCKNPSEAVCCDRGVRSPKVSLSSQNFPTSRISSCRTLTKNPQLISIRSPLFRKLKPTLRLSTSTFPQVAILFEITSTLVY
ncbi:hypothetical protein MJO28_006792 [Puccinia striiformis f. sp. tritici]|uniref:Uncharacterized protein n=2 Tax=Puccinia striiformis TaxID=27350 RepID=A0A2S4VKM8_9BASI|nr:hypothetical protein MJO28_006792 [Puccinia striiformis f. sp. tritici]POW09910.1 hypothetical protein PSHT_08894 [Puccinia striiformis]